MSKHMNILFLTYQGDMAGSTNSIMYLTRGLAEKGHNIYVGCRKESLLFQTLQGSAVNVVPMSFKSRIDWKNIIQIRRCVQQYQIQIINAQSSYDRYTSVLAKIFFNLETKVVHTRRQISKSMGGFFQNLIYEQGTDKIIAVSYGVKRSLAEKGLIRNSVTPESLARATRLREL